MQSAIEMVREKGSTQLEDTSAKNVYTAQGCCRCSLYNVCVQVF